MKRTLADRIAAYKRDKARLEERDRALRIRERKHRMRQIFDTGRMAERAGLLTIATETLYGAFRFIAQADEKQLARWTEAGESALKHEQEMVEKAKEPLVISFPNPVSRLAGYALREVGFRWVPALKLWAGNANLEDAEAIALHEGGQVKRIGGMEDLALAAE